MAGRWVRGIAILLALAGMVSMSLAQAPPLPGLPTDRLIIRFKIDAQGTPVRAGVDEAL
ncbi:MAG: hypothetical protein HYY78_04105, partial [Betaproteobacteria bacterium]|nr:hypothetical protein [Betaproteobacteria bacterium]